MKIYLISQSVNNNYDTYDAAVVIAAGEEFARDMHPSGYSREYTDDWTTPENVKVEYLGETNEKEARIVLASFNAG